jgi:hypothetical protein
MERLSSGDWMFFSEIFVDNSKKNFLWLNLKIGCGILESIKMDFSGTDFILYWFIRERERKQMGNLLITKIFQH